jgi:sterol desaturase/sphingolipid hydroxylase (fatty acid hydroxylase superfamily)
MGYEVEGRPGILGGCNFGILFPWWDMALGTARFSQEVHPTGVRGLTVSNNPLRHQWHGLVHSFKSLLSK